MLIDQKTIKIKMTPMVRWMVTFNDEITSFPEFFDRDLLEKLAARYHTAEERSRNMMQSLVKIDLLLLLSLYAAKLPSMKIFGFEVANLSFLSEMLVIALAYSSFSCGISQRRARTKRWSTESVTGSLTVLSGMGSTATAAYIDQELALHVNSQRLNIDPRQPDRWRAGPDMLTVQSLPLGLLLLTMGPLALLHLGVTGWAIWQLPYRAAVGLPLDLAIVALAIIVNICTLILTHLTHFRQFEFEKPVGN